MYRLLSSSIKASYVGSIMSGRYVNIPCSILGLGALFGGVVMQSVIIRFNEVFILYGLLKLVPIVCVMLGICVLLSYLYWQVKSTYVSKGFRYEGSKIGGVADFFSKM